MPVVQSSGSPLASSLSTILASACGAPPRATSRVVGVTNFLTLLRGEALRGEALPGESSAPVASNHAGELIQAPPGTGEGRQPAVPTEPKPAAQSAVGSMVSSLMPPPLQRFQFEASAIAGKEGSNLQQQQQTVGGVSLLALASPPIPAASESAPETSSDSAPGHSSASGQLRKDSKQDSSEEEIKVATVESPTPAFLTASPTPLPLVLSFDFGAAPPAEGEKLPDLVEFIGADGSNSATRPGRSAPNLTHEAHFSSRATPLSVQRSALQPLKEAVTRDTLAFRATLTPMEPRENFPLRNVAVSMIGTNRVYASPASTSGAGPAAQRLDPSSASGQPKMTPEEPTVLGSNEPVDLAENRQAKPDSPAEPDTKKPVSNAQSMVSNAGQLTDPAVMITPDRNITSSTGQSTNSSPPSVKPESKSEINAPSQPQPTREISVKVGHTEMPNVDIRLTDRGGKILVSVRSESPEFAQSLRSDLGDLVGRLERRGYQAETAVPVTGDSSSQLPGSHHPRSASQQDTAGHQSRHQNQQEPRRRAQPPPDSPTFSLEEVSHHDHELS